MAVVVDRLEYVLGMNTKELKTKAQDAEKTVQRSTGNMSKAFKAAGAAAVAYLGYRGLRAIIGGVKNLIELGAQASQTQMAFTNMARSIGLNAHQMLGELKTASEGTISQLDLMQKSAEAMALGLPVDALPKMMEIARASAAATGQSVSFMFDSIVKGTARQSRLILDNLGIIVKAEDLYLKATKELGRELTETEKRQVFLSGVLKAGEDIIGKVGDATLSTQAKLEKLDSTYKDIKVNLALATSAWLEQSGILQNLVNWTEKLRKQFGIMFTIEEVEERIATKTKELNELMEGKHQKLGLWESLKAMVTGIAPSLHEQMHRVAQELAELDKLRRKFLEKPPPAPPPPPDIKIPKIEIPKIAIPYEGLKESLDRVRDMVAEYKEIQQNRFDWLYEHEQISADQYMAFLEWKLEKFEEYSDEWIAIQQKIEDVKEGIADKDKERREKEQEEWEKQNHFMIDVYHSIGDAAGKAFTDIFTKNQSLIRSLADAWKWLLHQILNIFAEMLAKWIATKLIMASATGPFGFLFGEGGEVKRMQAGGLIPGLKTWRDSVPAMLTPGEFVMPRPAVQRIGVPALEQMRRTGDISRSVTVNVYQDMGGFSFSGMKKADAYLTEAFITERVSDAVKEALKSRELEF